ncbi:MAG TPA: type II secretion system protein [Terriglobales bacterium]|nr:type II secretion system protein [Terriglobales bacterium]
MTSTKNRGFTLIEISIVLAISFIAGGMFFMSLQPALKQSRVNNAYDETLMTLRRARDEAAAELRIYVVSFTLPGTITVTQNTTTGPILVTTVLPADVSFDVEAGIPNTSLTTPDGFGTGKAAIDFDQGVGGGNTSTIYFYPDGTARDLNGNINNGVVYLARPGDLYSSRAITLWGTTGRLRGWRLYNNNGAPYWRQQ